MAKKNLQSLINGIIGPESSEPKGNSRMTSSSPESRDNHELQPKRRGRPKSVGSSDEVRATLIMPAEVQRKLKYIALMESRLQKDIVGDALDQYIRQWETEKARLIYRRKIKMKMQ